MQTLIEMAIFIGYSFLAPIITAGGSMITTNALTIFGVDLIKATGITSMFFCVNACIVAVVFRKDIVWDDVRNMIIPVIVGGWLGAYILVNIPPLLLLIAMFCFSLHFIYKRVTMKHVGIIEDSRYKRWSIGFFSSAVTATALPGGGFLNAYLISKGHSLTQMFGTASPLITVTFAIKIFVLFQSGILLFADLHAVAYAIPFLVVANYLVRKGIMRFSRKTTDTLTVLAMAILTVYLFHSIILMVF